MRYKVGGILVSVLTTVAIGLMAGCGGGGGGSSSSNGGTGGNGNNGGSGGTNPTTTTRVVLNVNWPDRSRAISALSSAQSIKVVLTGSNADKSDFVWTINRDVTPAATAKRYVSPTLTQVGHWTAALTLYSLPDAGGIVVGTAGQAVDLATDGTGLDSLAITGVVNSVTIPDGQAVGIGKTLDFVFEAKDSAGNIVGVTPGSATWKVVTGQDKIQITSGHATGIAVGDATIQATVDGKTSPVTGVFSGPTSTTLNVTVKDPFGALIGGVAIDLVQNGVVAQHTTSSTGTAAIQTALNGSVDVKVTKTGFKPNQGSVVLSRLQPSSITIVLTAQGLPSASAGGTHVDSNGTTTLTFDVNVNVTDGDGNPISTLTGSNFTINPAGVTDATKTAVPLSSVQLINASYTSNPSRGPVSALIELDASGSVTNTSDPNGVRIQAAKTFFSALKNGDTAMLGYFPDGDLSKNLHPYTQPGFVTNGSVYLPILDQVKALVLQGSPIYNATIQAVDITAAQGTNANKAVVVFTDGQSNLDSATLEQTVSEAQLKGVRVYTAALGSGTDTSVLAQLATRTGGSLMYARDAGQLVTFYQSLSSLLSGAGSFYQTKWTATRSSGSFKSGDVLNGVITINAAGTTLAAPFFVQVP